MILAGIDEAGYGPLLGPLVVGCCAFEISDNGADPHAAPPDHLAPDLPCVWRRLKKHISKNRTKQSKKLHINDSKVVYAYETGLKELERAVLTLLATCTSEVAGLEDFINHTAQHVLDDLRQYPWYQPFDGERFPLEQDFLPIRLFANALKSEMEKF